MKCVITEKKSVAEGVAKIIGATTNKGDYFEGNGYIVTWCQGHLVTLKLPNEYGDEWGVPWSEEQLPMIPTNFKLKTISQSYNRYKVVSELIKNDCVESLIEATDAGREGELIFRLVYYYSGCRKPFQRLWINSMQDSDIRTGFKNLEDGRKFDTLYYAAKARQESDWLYGMNLSRLFSLKYHEPMSYGRVQTPTLKMIVDRYEENKNFKKTFTYQNVASFHGVSFAENESHEKKEDAHQVCLRVQGKNMIVKNVVIEGKKTMPPKLFDLGALQQEANKKYGFTANQTLELTQELYEKKFVTYPRTDSRYLNASMEKDVIQQVYSLQKISRQFAQYAFTPNFKRCIDDTKVSDHHAIIPTLDFTMGKVNAKNLSQNELKILNLITTRFVAASAEPYTYNSCKVETESEGVPFHANAKKETYKGWKQLEQEILDDDAKKEDAEESPKLFLLKKGMHFIPEKVEVKEIESKPRPLFTEASLLKAMENVGAKELKGNDEVERYGLGTSATRAGIIEELIHKGYVERKKKSLTPTTKGIYLTQCIPENLLKPDMTIQWEERMANIKNGRDNYDAFLQDVENEIKNIINEYKNKTFQKREIESTVIGKCPYCGTGEIVKKNTKKGVFYICSNHTNDEKSTCDFIISGTMKYFDNSISISDARLKTLLADKEITATVNGQKGEYKAKFKLKKNGKWFNLERTGYAESKKSTGGSYKGNYKGNGKKGYGKTKKLY